ncbi:MAG: methionine synthase [Ignavibacteria bacterium]|nr:methionine synthase [Ignavibacteria bacterium]
MIDIYEYDIDINELSLSRDIIERGLGYTSDTIPPNVSEVIDEMLNQIPEYLEMKAGFRILPERDVKIDTATISCNGITFETGKIITKRLQHSETLAVFVTTAGEKLEKWSKELMSHSDMLKGFIVDSIGSEVAELAADWLERKLSELIQPKGWKITNRYSPGYCEWLVKEQHKLFSLLPQNFCGIQLTESALMLPIKSVSGIIGLGKNVKQEDYQCSICDLEDCIRRKV